MQWWADNSYYISPNYLKQAIYGYGFVATYVQDQQIAKQADCNLRRIWWSVTQLFHAPTHQIAGPFRSTYIVRNYYERDGGQDSLYRNSLGKIPFYYPEQPDQEGRMQAFLSAMVPPSWPAPWIDQALTPPTSPRQVRQRVETLQRSEGEGFRQTTTYLSSQLALGSVNLERVSNGCSEPNIFRDHRVRPLIAHAVDANSGQIGAFQ